MVLYYSIIYIVSNCNKFIILLLNLGLALFLIDICFFSWINFFIFHRCGHCKKLKPEFERAATILKQNDPPVSLAKVSLQFILLF